MHERNMLMSRTIVIVNNFLNQHLDDINHNFLNFDYEYEVNYYLESVKDQPIGAIEQARTSLLSLFSSIYERWS